MGGSPCGEDYSGGCRRREAEEKTTTKTQRKHEEDASLSASFASSCLRGFLFSSFPLHMADQIEVADQFVEPRGEAFIIRRIGLDGDLDFRAFRLGRQVAERFEPQIGEIALVESA